ncbi:MAG: serine hydrolase domain-containing protein [Gemmatimonadota bacterium]
MRANVTVPLIAAFLALPAAVLGQTSFDEAAVDAVFSDFSATTPGCALGVVEDGGLRYGRGYGAANLEHGIPITTQSVFRSGSVSKQFTAAVVAIAAMDGHLSLEDELRTWVPEIPDYGDRLTILHTLNHTSGLRDYLTLMSLRGLRSSDFYNEVELIERQAAQAELNFEPGSEYLYSNSGYFLVTEAVARAVGMSFREYADEVLFSRLGMDASHFHDDHQFIVPLRADGYAPVDGGGFRTSMTTLEMIGDGGVYTSIEDLVSWLTAQEQDGLRSGLNDIVHAPGVLNDGETIPYALGLSHGEYRGLPTIGHGGAFVGFRAHTLRFPTEGLGLALLCNRSDANPGARIRQVADVVLAGRLDAPEQARAGSAAPDTSIPAVSPPGARDFVGSYYSAELDVTYRISVEDESLRVRAGAAIDEELFVVDGDTLATGFRRSDGRVQPQLILRFDRSAGQIRGFELDAGRVVHLAFERVDGA